MDVASVYFTASSPATLLLGLVLEIYAALFNVPVVFKKGYLLVPFVGSIPAMIPVPKEPTLYHRANVPPGKIPVPAGAVKVFPAA